MRQVHSVPPVSQGHIKVIHGYMSQGGNWPNVFKATCLLSLSKALLAFPQRLDIDIKSAAAEGPCIKHCTSAGRRHGFPQEHLHPPRPPWALLVLPGRREGEPISNLLVG